MSFFALFNRVSFVEINNFFSYFLPMIGNFRQLTFRPVFILFVNSVPLGIPLKTSAKTSFHSVNGCLTTAKNQLLNYFSLILSFLK